MKPISILALQQISGIGVKTVEKILSISGISEPLCPLDLIEVIKRANLEFGRINVPDIQTATKSWDKAQEILNLSQQQNIKIISQESPYYPKCLSMIANPPILLHIKGNIDALNKDGIAIVGTRKPSDYGKTQAKKIAGLFAKEGYVIVSGLAEGVDSAAHNGALESNGLTVAVLAHGLDMVYPYRNKELADAIIKNNGALVSEYPIGTKIFRSYFVERDRIQSGLSLGVLVIETGIKGGTMHTVGFCEQQKRVLIVLKHPQHLLNTLKPCGNTKLITENRANMVFDNDDNIGLAKDKMQKKREDFLSLKSTHQISPSTIHEFKPPTIETSELTLTHASLHQSNSFVTIDGRGQPAIKTIKEDPLKFESAYNLSHSVSSVGYAQPNKTKKKKKKKDLPSNNRKLVDFEEIVQ